MNPDFRQREVYIPGIGGPFIETTDGCWVSFAYGPSFQPEPAPERRSPLRAFSAVAVGTLIGWIGHAVLI